MKKLKLADIRSKLNKRESDLRSDIDVQSSKLEEIINSNITRVAIVGVGAIAAYFVFRSLTSKGKKKQKKSKSGSNKSQKENSPLTQKIISTALKTIIPYTIDKIKTKEPVEKS